MKDTSQGFDSRGSAVFKEVQCGPELFMVLIAFYRILMDNMYVARFLAFLRFFMTWAYRIHTYIHTYVRTYVRACVRTYVRTCLESP